MATIVPAMTQELITRQGSATVPILNENVVRAEKEATLLAKQTIVKELLAQFIAPQLLTQVQKLIEEKILKQPDHFIESVRVIASQETEALTEFTVLLEARILQGRLVSAIKRLNIVLINDPLRHTVLLYDPQAPLWDEVLKEDSLLILNRLLNPYKINIQKSIPLHADWLMLAEANPQQSLPRDLLIESDVSTFLRIDISQESFRQNEQLEIVSATLKMILYEAVQGNRLDNIVISMEFENWQPGQAINLLLEKAALQWFPLITDLITADQKKGTILRVRMTGFTNPQQEEIFVQNVFHSQNSWEQFQLHTLSKDYVVYQGYYLGELQTLIPWFAALQHPLYQVKEPIWQENELRLEVQWHEEIAALATYKPIDVVEKWSIIHNIKVTQQTDSADRVKTTFALPLFNIVYDYLRSRGDSTLYQVQWPKSNRVVKEVWYEMGQPPIKKVVKGVWYQIDKTNLTPVVSIYDAKRNLVKELVASGNGRIDFQYRLSSLQNHFYIRVSDQIGYIEGEAGSYLSLHYVLNVSPLYTSDIR